MVTRYAANTHAATHNTYTLKVTQVKSGTHPPSRRLTSLELA